MSKETYMYKRKALCAARDLCYPESVISRLKLAETEGEIERIMKTARLNMED